MDACYYYDLNAEKRAKQKYVLCVEMNVYFISLHKLLLIKYCIYILYLYIHKTMYK